MNERAMGRATVMEQEGEKLERPRQRALAAKTMMGWISGGMAGGGAVVFLVGAAALLLPLLAGDNLYLLRVEGSVGIYVMLALGLNVVTGYAGLFDMGYVAFYGVGAYTYALLASPQLGVHLPFAVAVVVAVLATVLLGALVCLPTLRLRGDYLAIVTLSFAEIVRILFNNLDRPVNITNGPNGIVGVDPPAFFGVQLWDLTSRYYLIWALALGVLFVVRRLERARTGRAWNAVRDDAVAAATLGIHVDRYKLLAFMWGAGVAGLAGANFAAWQGAVFPQNFGMAELVTVYCMLVLGGTGNAAGVVLGAAAIAVLPEVLRSYSVYRMLIYGAALIAIIRFRPQGLFPARKRPFSTIAGPVIDVLAPHGATKPCRQESCRQENDAQAGECSEGPAALEVERLSVSFGGLRALDEISFRVRPGEAYGIIGPNGAGKTTLLNVISGLNRPSSGKVFLFGRDITGLRPDLINQMGLGRTFQNIRLFSGLGVKDNLLTGCHRRLGRGVAEREVSEEAWRTLRLVGLEKIGGVADVGALVYADRRKLEIARALLTGARVLLLDEPAAGMTAPEVKALAEQIRTLKTSGFTVILIEHHMELVMDVCDRVLVLDHGRKLAEGPPEEVRNDPGVLEAYIGRADARKAEARTKTGAGDDHVVGTAGVVAGGRFDGRPAPLLKLSAVSSGYGPVDVLHDVSLEVGHRELVCLLGSNAAGKSTLLRTVVGLVPLKRGFIEFEGRRLDGLATEAVIRAGIAVVPEGRRVFGRLTVVENLAAAYHDVGGDRAKWEERLEFVFSLFPVLANRRFQKAGTLSGGEQQMLAIGRALISRPKLILMDEPSMGLAPVVVERVLDAVATIRDLGTAVLLVEQNALAALSIADWGYVLKQGVIARSGSARELAGEEAVSDAYLGAVGDV